MRNDRGKLMFSINAAFTELKIDEAWRLRQQREFTTQEESAVQAYLANMEDPNYFAKNHYFQFQQTEQSIDPEYESLAEKLNPNHLTILVMPNVEWDTTVLSVNPHRVFPSHRQWLIKTIQKLSTQHNINVIVRPHPAEGYFGVSHLVDQIWGTLENVPDHVHLLSGKSKINTYGLMKVADLGLVYTSDVGWEMTLRGKPVIAAGKGITTGKGILLDASSKENYFNLLNKFFDDPKAFTVTHQQKQNAAKFCHMYILRVQKRYPWTIGNFWAELEQTPLSSFFKDDGFTKYKDSFDILTGERKLYEGLMD
jgi:hypothetical protein